MTCPFLPNLEDIREMFARILDDVPEVVGFDVEAGNDSTNDPAIWVHLRLNTEDLPLERALQIENKLKPIALANVPSASWVYVNFNSAKELAELERESD